MNKNIVIIANEYDRIDGRNAYQSDIKRFTIGKPILEENKNTQIALQLWKENSDGELTVSIELPIHQVMDLMLLLSRTMLHFREAYRFPLLYNEENPVLCSIMEYSGFESYEYEWWHYVLKKEPYPDSYFDFLVA